ncbi:hypothetical protein VULLAG_LOCUS9801 [Vulpes lagopus]
MGFLICTMTNSNSRSSSLINKQRPGKAADESRRRQRGSSLNALGRAPWSRAHPRPCAGFGGWARRTPSRRKRRFPCAVRAEATPRSHLRTQHITGGT